MPSTGMIGRGRRDGSAGASIGTGRSWAGRVLIGAVGGSAALLLLSGCSVVPGSHGSLTVSGTAGPAGVDPAGSASATPKAEDSSDDSKSDTDNTDNTDDTGGSKSDSDAQPAGSAKGCAAGGIRIPKGAGQAKTTDLDGDGKADTVWVADLAGKRTLGVRTASGAGFSRSFSSAAPQNASATAGLLGDGTAVILLDFSRSVQLFAVTGCKIVATRNAQGAQYTFDHGFTGFGTGVGCPKIGNTGRHLVGYLATETGSKYKVTRTTIDLSRGGVAATNGTVTTLGTNLAAGSATVKAAQGVSCGSNASAVEPIS